jgi:GMP reductase
LKAEWIKNNMPNCFLIVGNVATPEAVEDIQDWGVDAIKVGIAGGKVCISKNKTGFFRPMVSSLKDCVSVSKIPIIADGGVEQHGDVAKALVCGATMIMAGYLFAGYDLSAGEIIEIDDRQYKQYFGSASKYNKKEQRNIEGRKILIPYRGSIEEFINELKQDLQSSISYAGGSDLSAFKNVKYRLIL